MIFVSLFAPLVPFALVAGLVGFLLWWQSKQRRQRYTVWAHVAHELGLGYHNDRIEGRRNGQPVRVAIVVRGSGKNRHTYTVVSSMLPVPLDVGLSVRSHGFFEDLFRSGRDIQVGDHAFDMRYLIGGDEDHRVRALLGPNLRHLMLHGLGGTSSFSLTDRGFSVECSGASSHRHWLLWAIDLATRVTAAIEQSRPQVPPASPIARYVNAWETYAHARGLRGMVTPLCMWGTIDGIAVHAYARRTGRLSYGLSLSLKFPAPVSSGLLVRPKQSMDGIASLFGAQDHRLGDPPFDDAFIVKAPTPHHASALLDAPIRAALLQLHTSLGPISLADDRLTVELPYFPQDPSVVPKLVHHVTGVADAITRKAKSSPVQVGPYR